LWRAEASLEVYAGPRRVAPGDCSPRAPTDPDVRVSRIRLLRAWVRYVPYRWTMRGSGRGKRSSNAAMRGQGKGRWERRESHFHQVCFTS